MAEGVGFDRLTSTSYLGRGQSRLRDMERVEGVGFDRLRLAPRGFRSGVPQGAQFIRE